MSGRANWGYVVFLGKFAEFGQHLKRVSRALLFYHKKLPERAIVELATGGACIRHRNLLSVDVH